jgi:LacI family transcriptional regulator
MTEAGLSVGTDQVAQGYFTYRSGMEAAERLLDRFDPTAIFASNDDMAAATTAVAHRKGLEVPGDISIVGFDDTPLATTVWPELTTIRQPIADMAREAVRLLIEGIKGRRSGNPPQVVHRGVKFTLVKRESSGPVPQKPASRRKSPSAKP